MNNYQSKAQRKVEKAVSVFDQAVMRIQEAQDILKDGVAKDNEKIRSNKKLIKDLEDQQLVLEQEKQEKMDTLDSNHKLITKLEEFK